MAWTLTTSGAAIVKAGEDVNSSIVSGAELVIFSNQAEGRIVQETRKNWVDNYASATTAEKNVLNDACSSLIANNLIMYDLSGYSRIAEAQTLLSINDNIYNRCIKILKESKNNEVESL